MEYARHLFGLVVPVKAVCYGHGLLCKLSIADLKLIVEYTLRTAVCKVGSVSVTDDCCLCGKLRALHCQTWAAAEITGVCWAAWPHCLYQI